MKGCLDTSLQENHRDEDLEPVSLPLHRNISLKEISLLASRGLSVPASRYLSLFYSKCCTAAWCTLHLSGLPLNTAEKFHFVPPLLSTHQVPPRESASVAAHTGYLVKHIAFKPLKSFMGQAGGTSETSSLLVDCNNKWEGLQILKER